MIRVMQVALFASALASAQGCAELGVRGFPRKPEPASSANAHPARGAPEAPAVVINHERVDAEDLAWLERQYGSRIPDGNYWYDARAGLWGYEGGPPAGSAVPNLAIAGPLRPDASHGTSGVFVNGRELHSLEIAALMNLTVVIPGRYWLDAAGNGGFEGGPALWNIHQLSGARASQGSSSGSPWMKHGSGIKAGGDGKGYVFVQGDGYSHASQ